MAPLAVSCHPFADWHKQHFTDKERYRELERDLGGVARRMLICGMHVHVGIDDDETRIDLMAQFPYFLPHLLALSTSSPYLEGRRYRAEFLQADGVRQSAQDRLATAVFFLVGISSGPSRSSSTAA
jgi:gamma-glutamyl:cysteine ligase YbdK (ATP-grasp superfamily)